MSDAFSQEVNFIFNCAIADLTTLKEIIFNSTNDQLKAIVEAVINAEQLSNCKAAHKLASDLQKRLLSVPEGLWRECLREDSRKLRTILANVTLSCVQEELLGVLCYEDENTQSHGH